MTLNNLEHGMIEVIRVNLKLEVLVLDVHVVYAQGYRNYKTCEKPG